MTSADTHLQKNYRKKTVLIVDDMPQVRQDLRQLLELTGLFEIVAEAADDREAIRQANILSPDAVVIDLEMAGVDGYEVTRLIKAQNPFTRVIILSAYGSPEEIEHALAVGADGFVLKGERYEILVDAIIREKTSPNLCSGKRGE
ncbi:MAG TPA: response regulator transcription factor [Anaerolineales bacterium]|nr:response regulator transcription factor [Anaerolineales bacterium]